MLLPTFLTALLERGFDFWLLCNRTGNMTFLHPKLNQSESILQQCARNKSAIDHVLLFNNDNNEESYDMDLRIKCKRLFTY